VPASLDQWVGGTCCACRVLRRQHSLNSGDGALDVGVARLPIADRHAHASSTTPGRPTEERFSALYDPRDDLVGPRIVIDCSRARLGTEEPDQSLVDSRCPHDLGARGVKARPVSTVKPGPKPKNSSPAAS
jgi:hypothetical protein